MGLDMWLNKKTYIGNNYNEPEDQVKIDIQGIKQNVDNVQNGEDNCQEYPVDQEALKELLDIVNKVLLDHDKAGELLPTSNGFFYGGADYDEYYFKKLEDTKNILESALAEGGDFYYEASW